MATIKSPDGTELGFIRGLSRPLSVEQSSTDSPLAARSSRE
jgi:hypothetical protein